MHCSKHKSSAGNHPLCNGILKLLIEHKTNATCYILKTLINVHVNLIWKTIPLNPLTQKFSTLQHNTIADLKCNLISKTIAYTIIAIFNIIISSSTTSYLLKCIQFLVVNLQMIKKFLFISVVYKNMEIGLWQVRKGSNCARQ